MLEPYLADRAAADTKLDIARTATAAITTMFTYTPEDMDQLSARSAKYLGGELKDAYAKQVDALAATNKQNQIHRNAQVVGAAVESLNGPTATAMVYANVTYTSAATKDVPKIFLVSYRLTMQRKGSNWLITNMPWITSKDLTRLTP
jgi:Mce-associated membrane protein